VVEQALRERRTDGRTDAWYPLQQEELSRCETFRLPVESPQNSLVRSAHLIGKEVQHAR
jgi:hypothetical protein